MKSKLSNRYRYYFLVLGAVLLLIVIGMLLWKSTYGNIITSFSVTANSELVRILSSKEQASKWIFVDATLRDSNFEIIKKKFTGSIDIFDSVFIEVERVALGPLIVRFRSNNSNKPLIAFEDINSLGQKDTIYNDFEIVIANIVEKANKGITHIFSFEGRVDLGKVNDEPQSGDGNPVLRSGEIAMLGKNILEDSTYFKAGEETLNLGDRLIFPYSINSVGYLSINEKAGLQINYRTEAYKATIIKPGMKAQGFDINVSTFDKWLNDRDLQRISIISAVFVVLMALFTFLMDFTNFIKPNKD